MLYKFNRNGGEGKIFIYFRSYDLNNCFQVIMNKGYGHQRVDMRARSTSQEFKIKVR